MSNRQSNSGIRKIGESIRKQHRGVSDALDRFDDGARTLVEIDCQLARMNKACIAPRPRYLDSLRSHFTDAYDKKAAEYEAATRILRGIEIQLIRLGRLKLRNDGLEQEYKEAKRRLVKLRLSAKLSGLLCKLTQGFNSKRDPDEFSFFERLRIELRVAVHGVVIRLAAMGIFVAAWIVLIALAYFLLTIIFGLE